MPIKRNHDEINVDEAVIILRRGWHRTVNTLYKNFDMEYYHPIDEVILYINRIIILETITENKKLNKRLSILGLYLVYKNMYRMEGYVWQEYDNKKYTNDVKKAHIHYYHNFKGVIKELMTPFSGDYKYDRIVDTINDKIKDITKWYHTCTQDIYDYMVANLNENQMYNDPDETNKDWKDAFESAAVDETIDHIGTLYELNDELKNLVNMVWHKNDNDLQKLMRTLDVAIKN